MPPVPVAAAVVVQIDAAEVRAWRGGGGHVEERIWSHCSRRGWFGVGDGTIRRKMLHRSVKRERECECAFVSARVW